MKTIKIPHQLFRSAEIVRTKRDDGTEEMQLSISSDTPYKRYDWWDDEEYYEVLDHGPDGMDTSRLKAGLPMLFNHDRDAHLGRASGYEIKDGKCYVKGLVWSESEDAQTKKKDMESGALPDTSVGYQITDDGECIGAKDGIPIYKFKWSPYEFSLVTIPADITVGAGRSESKPSGEPKEINIRDEKGLAKQGNSSQKQPNKRSQPDMKLSKSSAPKFLEAETGGGAGGGGEGGGEQRAQISIEQERATGAQAERARVAKIQQFSGVVRERKYALKKPIEQIEAEAIKNGSSFDDYRQAVLDEWDQARKLEGDEANANLGMSKKDLRRWSMRKMILEASSKGGLTGIEKEASEAARSLYAAKDGRVFDGCVIPNDVLEARTEEIHDLNSTALRNLGEEVRRIAAIQQRSLSASSFSGGGFLVATEILGGSFIDYLRNAALLGQGPLGVIELNGLVGNIAIPKQNTTATVYWLAEGASLTESSFTGGQLYFTPHRMGCQTNWTKQLLLQASLSVEMLVRNDQARAIAVEEDRTGLNGTGLNGEPLGIAHTTGVGADVTFGGNATRVKMLLFEYNIENANAINIGELAFMTTPKSKNYMRNTLMVASSTFPIYVWGDMLPGYPVIAGAQPGNVVGYPGYATKNVPSDLVFGGIFQNNLTRARWGGMDLLTEPYTGAASETIKTYLHQWLDWGLRYPAAMEVSTDAPTSP